LTLEDKPLKSLDLVKSENGVRPVPARTPTLPTNGFSDATNGAATNGNGVHANGNGLRGLEHRGGDSATIVDVPVVGKRARTDTTADSEDQNTKRTKLAPNQTDKSILIEDDDGAIVLD